MPTTATPTQESSTRWAPVPDVDKLTILKLLAAGRSPAFAASATQYPPARVRQLATAHGYPDLDKVAWAVDVVAADIERAELERVTDPAPAPQGSAEHRPTERARATRAASPVVRAVPAAPPAEPTPTAPPARPPAQSAPDATSPAEEKAAEAPAADSVRGLIARGSKSTRVRTQRLAVKVADLVAALEDALRVEEEARRAAAEAAQAKAREQAERAAQERRIRAELEEVERRRTELLRQLHPTRPSRPAPAPRDIDPKVVRRWARANGVEVPNAGRVPVRVVEQYLASTKAA